MSSLAGLFGGAIFIGLIHGAEPGHGWPIAATYAFEKRRKWIFGTTAALIIGVGHLISSIAVVVFFFALKNYFGLDRIEGMNYIAGVMLIGLGIWEYFRGHSHTHGDNEKSEEDKGDKHDQRSHNHDQEHSHSGNHSHGSGGHKHNHSGNHSLSPRKNAHDNGNNEGEQGNPQLGELDHEIEVAHTHDSSDHDHSHGHSSDHDHSHGHSSDHDHSHGHSSDHDHSHNHSSGHSHSHEESKIDKIKSFIPFVGGHSHSHSHSHSHDHSQGHGLDSASEEGLLSLGAAAFFLGFAHEEEFEIIAICAGSSLCLELMLAYAFAVIFGIVVLTLLLIAGYKRYEERFERYSEYFPVISASVLVIMGIGFILGVL